MHIHKIISKIYLCVLFSKFLNNFKIDTQTGNFPPFIIEALL